MEFKAGDDGHFGQKFPVELGSEPQRVEIAKLVAKFIADVKAQNPNANIVSMGDFNDFEFSKPLKVHEGEHMTNMVHHVPEKERYSYVYQGNSQVLDHILVSNHLVDRTKVDMLKVNADFTDKSGRASDHDPIMAELTLGSQVLKRDQIKERSNLRANKIVKQRISMLESTHLK